MNWPIPNATEISEFQALYERRLNAILTERDAFEALKAIVHLYYAKYFALRDLREKE